ncbi:MAG: hypothetical protein GX079_01575 [Tissierellia bacterium]|nr:hypothetical protein [Tissierellia bacterium]
MSLLNYKCPSCGASITYDPNQDMGHCEFCGSTFTLDELEKYNKEDQGEEKAVGQDGAQEKVQDDEEISGYTCENCGAEVVSDTTTSATFCYYCHSPVIIKRQLAGDFKPDYIVPFAIDKKKAQETFLSWANKQTYVPRSFTEDSQLEKITGVYLPYWFADVKTNVNVSGVGTTTNVYTRGDTEYTEYMDYAVNANGDFDIKGIPELAFTQIDRDLVKSVDDFSSAELRDFNMLYLSGFFSEKYDIDKEEVKSSFLKQAQSYAEDYVNSQFAQYDSVKRDVDQVDTNIEKISYVLLPTWVLTYQYLDKNYVYMLNGLTGEAFGELPVDKTKLGIRSGLIFLVVMVLALLGGRFLW